MENFNLTKEQKVLLNLTSMSLSKTPADLKLTESEVKDVDWSVVVKESIAQAIPLVGFNSASYYKDFIPNDVYAYWMKISMRVLQKNYLVTEGQDKLLSLLGEKYKYIILKGTAAASYYPIPENRGLGDVDFLIDTTKQTEIEELLQNNGYEKSMGDHPNHYVFKKDSDHLEMHFEVAGVPYGIQGESVRLFFKNAVNSSQIKFFDQSKFNSPSDIHHGLILLLHMQHHMLSEGLGLRHLSDWAAYVSSTHNLDFWELKLIPFLKKIGLFVYASIMTKVCAKYLKIACPNWAKEADDKTCDEVIYDILTGGNFGQKDNVRSKSGMLISEHGKSGTKHGAIYNLSHALHKAVLLQYPIVEKIWILYPFIYLYKAVRFLFLSMIGKRPSLIKIAPEASKRKSIYDKLHVFEIEKEEK